MHHEAECSANFSNSSKAMEAVGAVQLWKRSIEKNGLRYTSFVGDGDSASQALQNFFSSASLFKLKCMFPTGHRRHFACT